MWALSWHVWIMQTPWINEYSVQDTGMITISPSHPTPWLDASRAGALCLLPVSRRSQFVLSPPDLSIFGPGNYRQEEAAGCTKGCPISGLGFCRTWSDTRAVDCLNSMIPGSAHTLCLAFSLQKPSVYLPHDHNSNIKIRVPEQRLWRVLFRSFHLWSHSRHNKLRTIKPLLLWCLLLLLF